MRPSPGHPQIPVRGPCQEPGKVPHGLCPSTGFLGLAVSAGPPHRGPHLEGGEPHKPVQAVVVRGDEAWPPLQVTGLALELVVLPLGVWCAGIGAGGALQDDFRAFLGDAGWGGDQSGLHLPTLTPTPDLSRPGQASPSRLPTGVMVAPRYLPKAPYVLTIRRGLKELFMTCWGLSKLSTTGTLSQATRTPSARLTVCRATLPAGRGNSGWAPAPRPGLCSAPWAHRSRGRCCCPHHSSSLLGPPAEVTGPPFLRTRTHCPYQADRSDPVQAWRCCPVSQGTGVGTGLGAINSRPPGLPSHIRLQVSPTVCPWGPGPSSFLLLHPQDLVLEGAGPRGKQEAQSGIIEAGEAGHDGQPVQEAQIPADDEDHLGVEREIPSATAFHVLHGDAWSPHQRHGGWGSRHSQQPVLTPRCPGGPGPKPPDRPLAPPPSDQPHNVYILNDLRGGRYPVPLVRTPPVNTVIPASDPAWRPLKLHNWEATSLCLWQLSL